MPDFKNPYSNELNPDEGKYFARANIFIELEPLTQRILKNFSLTFYRNLIKTHIFTPKILNGNYI